MATVRTNLQVSQDKVQLRMAEQLMNPYDLCSKADISYASYLRIMKVGNCHIPSRRGWDTMRNVQIPQELFMKLLRFHLVEDESYEKEIKKELEKKLDKMVMRDLFGKSKTAPTKEEREQARKEYLDKRGVPESFRW